MKNIFLLRTGVLFAVAITGACTSGGPRSETLQVHLSADPASLDPSLVEDAVSLKVLNNIMVGLVAYDNRGKLQKRLAQSYEISPDGKSYRFKLRPDARWSDNRSVRAADFIVALRRALSPTIVSKLSGLLYPIRGAEAFHRGKTKELVGVYEKDGDLIIELEHPAPYFLQALALPIGMPLRADVLERDQGKWKISAPVTGSYRIKSHQPNQDFVLEKNPWTPPSAPSQVILRVVQDESTAAGLFEQGKLDILMRVPPHDYERFKKEGFLRTDPMPATFFLGFNFKKPPFNDRDYRLAVASVVRKKELVRALGSGEQPASSWIPPGIEGHYAFDENSGVSKSAVERVRALQRKKPISGITAGFDTSGRNQMIMEKVQQDLKEGLGLQVSLINMDWKSYLKALSSDPPSIYRFGWLSPIDDPIFHLRAFVTGDPYNLSGWSNAEYDAIVSQIIRMPAGPARGRLLKKAQELIVEKEAIVVPLYHYVQVFAVSKRVHDFAVSPYGVTLFEEIRMDGSR